LNDVIPAECDIGLLVCRLETMECICLLELDDVDVDVDAGPDAVDVDDDDISINNLEEDVSIDEFKEVLL
jgi:hypothetical protein